MHSGNVRTAIKTDQTCEETPLSHSPVPAAAETTNEIRSEYIPIFLSAEANRFKHAEEPVSIAWKADFRKDARRNQPMREAAGLMQASLPPFRPICPFAVDGLLGLFYTVISQWGAVLNAGSGRLFCVWPAILEGKLRMNGTYGEKDKVFLKGVSFGFMARSGYYRSAAGRNEIDAICDLGVNYVALITTVVQEHYYSTRMFSDYRLSPSDIELAETIEAFHRRGVHVMLKPMIECLDSCWRGNIRFPEKQMMIQGVEVDYWSRWFGNYAGCMEHFARLASDTGTEMFCAGCELKGCEPQESHWPAVLDQIRGVYKGMVTYNADQCRPGENFVRKWFSGLDLLGVSFYTGTRRENPGAEGIAEDLRPAAELLGEVSRRVGVPLFFAECGSRSVVNGSREPWRYDNAGAYDGGSQSDYLSGVIRAFSGQPWWRGLLWWKWEEQQRRPHYEQPGGDTGFTIRGKPAEGIMRRWCEAEA